METVFVGSRAFSWLNPAGPKLPLPGFSYAFRPRPPHWINGCLDPG